MRALPQLWLLLPLASACADSGHTRTVLKNSATSRLVVECSGPTGSVELDQLDALQAAYQADTCFLTKPDGEVMLVKTLAAGDSLPLGEGREALVWQLTTPPLEWQAVTVRPAAGPPIRFTAATIKPLVTSTYLERYSCCGEYVKITRIYRLALP